MREQAGLIVRDLFSRFFVAPDLMPPNGRRPPPGQGPAKRAGRVICDYIAGMTDRYAAAEHKRLFDETPELQ
ncbi:MAG: hypothetical protein ACREDT_07130 [Methylocella sp.]